ncbi:MAG: hypothetical protein Q7S74_00015 [Nanoarchaeota archaeon]|nr:hypothetical protein [Nanoarchaeota archaeon]
MKAGGFSVLFVILLILLSMNVLAISDASVGSKVYEKKAISKNSPLLQERYANMSALDKEFTKIESSQKNSLITTASTNIEVLYPTEGFYYVTDYLEVALQTDTIANCQYNFQSSGFKSMEFSNDTLHYHYFYHLEDNMASEDPYVIDFKCFDGASSEFTASTYFWINTTDLDRYFLRHNIDGWSYLLSNIGWSGNENGLLEVYRGLYNKSNDIYTRTSVFIFDNPSSIQGFIDNEIVGVFDNVSISIINGSRAYTFQDESGGKYAAWTYDKYVISSNVFAFENSTPVTIQLPLNLIGAYLQKYPSDVNITITCFTNAQCNDSNPYTFDRCVSSGQLNATCTHQAIQCLKNSDCGNSSTIKFCSNNNICNSTKTYTCASSGTPQSTCSSSIGESCSICLFGCNNQTFICKTSPIITIFSPVHNRVYNITSLPFNLTIGNYSFSEISFIDWTAKKPSWIILCKNCNEYGFKKKVIKPFGEGEHNLTFRAVNGTVTITKNLSFLVDSKKPKILITLPKNKGFTNGSNFYVKYSEDNCKSLLLNFYGNISNKTTNMNCSSGVNIEKIISNNLSAFNNQEIEYQFVIKDISNNSAESRKIKIKVDTTKPIINSFVNTTNGKRVTFTLNITELNFDEVNYIDYNDAKPAVKLLCSSLKNGICSSTKTLRAGNHNITIKVLDKAGNSVQKITKLNIV